MNDVHVVEARSEMTGGRCYTYWGKLSDGTFFVWFDDVFSILDSDYSVTFTPEFFKETDGDTYRWEKEHTLRTLEAKYMWHFIKEIIKLTKD